MNNWTKQQRWQEKMKRLGRCIICGKPLVTRWHCEKHNTQHTKLEKKRRERLKLKKISSLAVSVMPATAKPLAGVGLETLNKG